MSAKMIIIDGSSLIHRAFYALPLLMTGSGLYTNAVYGFATMLVKLLADHKPDAVIVALDKSRITFRNEVYGEYKAHRKPTPRELSEQFPLVRQLLAAFGIATMEEGGYEADDIIGTMAVKGAAAGFEVIIVTGDRDALQLLQPAVSVMLTRKGISDMELFDRAVFRDKYGVEAEQLIDLKGLMGDTSDNIPGVPGIGEKTALKLIREFGSVENLLANVDQVAGKKLQENLRNYAELAVISKRLATIVTDMPIAFERDAYVMQPDFECIKTLLTRFEFKSLLARLEVVFPAQHHVGAVPVEAAAVPVITVCSQAEMAVVIQQIHQQQQMAFYLVASGRIPCIHISGIAVMGADDPVYVAADSEAWPMVLEVLSDHAIGKATHDVKMAYAACLQLGVCLHGPVFDTALAAYLIDPTASQYPLTVLKEKYLGLYSEQSGKTIIDDGFAVQSVVSIQALQPVLINKLTEMDLLTLYQEVELPLIEVLVAMETAGIGIDSARLALMSDEIGGKLEVLLGDIYQLAGEEFNVNSPKQLGVILFEKLNLTIIKKTKTGYSTDAEVLEKLSGCHPVIDKLLEYRLLTKLKSTYLDGLQGLIEPHTGRVHTSFNQMVTATGRLSSSDPNLQNIPVRSEAGKRIRELFVPGNDYQYLLSADYSQIELRILAHMSGDDNFVDAFQNNQDIHSRTAAEVFGVAMTDVTDDMRNRAKAVNFGIVYGISDYGLSRDLGVTRKEAAQYIDSYFVKCHGVKAFIDDMVAQAHQNGYVTTLFGRRRYLPEINSGNYNQRSFAERTAMNTPIQGSAADVIKKAMIDVYKQLKQRRLTSRILLQVHDELVIEAPAQELEAVSLLVKQAMETAVQLTVPLTAEVKAGKNWAEAK